jgi:tetratricopeptide (TPR) repeat protein
MQIDVNSEVTKLQRQHMQMARAGATPDQMRELENRFHRMLNLYPDHPALLYSLGNILSQSDRSGAGICLLRQAIECGADEASTLINMAVAYKMEHDDQEAAACYQRAIRLLQQAERQNAKRARNGKPPTMRPEAIRENLTLAYHGMASLFVNAGDPLRIIEWADKALALNPGDRFAEWNKGLGLLESGQWAEGWERYDTAGFREGGYKPIDRKLKTYGGLPRWDGQKGHTVICYGEQGIGDEVMFASMLPDLMKDCRVIIDCDKRLEGLFRRSFPQAEAVYPTSDADAPFPWLADHEVDGYVPMGSLGRYYRPDAESFPRTPYLKADPERIEKWRYALKAHPGLRIGISWAGGLKKTRFDQRSMPLSDWADVLKVPGISWFSLQYHKEAADECADVGRTLGVPIHHWGDVVADYEETAGFLHNLDLVISVNTSLIHLAGALGIDTWCLTPKMVAWRYGCEGPNPFYGSVEMFRQERRGEWKPVLDRVASVLQGAQAREAA